MTTGPRCIRPGKPLAPGVQVLTTLRFGGVSEEPYASLNPARHVGDAPEAVQANRERIRAAFRLPAEPLWLRQVHGTRVVPADAAPGPGCPEADGALTFRPGRVLAVLTADCLPIVLAARDGSALAVAHAGWRGLAAGVLPAAVAALETPPDRLAAWIGPGIGPARYEVDARVREAFAELPGSEAAFAAGRDDAHWFCDLPRLAGLSLALAGVTDVEDCGLCTHADPDRFYSYRRDGETGRMATLAWMER